MVRSKASAPARLRHGLAMASCGKGRGLRFAVSAAAAAAEPAPNALICGNPPHLRHPDIHRAIIARPWRLDPANGINFFRSANGRCRVLWEPAPRRRLRFRSDACCGGEARRYKQKSVRWMSQRTTEDHHGAATRRYAPDFEAQTTEAISISTIDRKLWAVLFPSEGLHAHLHHRARLYGQIKPEFDKRGSRSSGSRRPVDNHAKWANDIKETQGFAPNTR